MCTQVAALVEGLLAEFSVRCALPESARRGFFLLAFPELAALRSKERVEAAYAHQETRQKEMEEAARQWQAKVEANRRRVLAYVAEKFKSALICPPLITAGRGQDTLPSLPCTSSRRSPPLLSCAMPSCAAGASPILLCGTAALWTPRCTTTTSRLSARP